MISTAIAGQSFSALSMNKTKLTKPENEKKESIADTFQDKTKEYFRDKFTGVEYIGDRVGNIAGQATFQKWDSHTKSVANSAFNSNVLRNAKGQFVKGSNAAAGQVAQEAVENSVIRKTVGTVGKTFVKGASSTGIGVVVDTTIDLSVGDHTKEFAQETIGKNIPEGIATAVVTAGIIATGIVGSGVIATAAVTIAVGTAVAVGNNWLRNNIPAVRDFENGIGELAVSAYDGVKSTAVSAYNNQVKLIGFATKQVISASSVVASAGKVLIDDAAVASTIAALNAAKNPLKAIKKENNTIIEEMNQALRKAKNTAHQIPFITSSDVEEVIAKHGLSVHHQVKAAAIDEANHEVDQQLTTIDQLISGIRRTASHAHSQDQEWAARF